MKRLAPVLLVFVVLMPFHASAYQEHTGLDIKVWHNSVTERKVKEMLNKEAPEMKDFIDSHRVLNVLISGNEIFCINEFVVYDRGGGIVRAVMLLFSSRNERIDTYCHPVNGFSYGFLFIPRSKSVDIDFSYKSLRGGAVTEREIEI